MRERAAFTGPVQAARDTAGRLQGPKSKDAAGLLDMLLSVSPAVRRNVLASLEERELRYLLNESGREHGTLFKLWHDTPSGFVEDVLGETIWSRQREVLDCVMQYKRTIVPAGFGVGKTHLAARSVLHFVNTSPPGSALAVTTATRFRQVRYQLWPHIRRAVARSGLPGTCDTTQYKLVSPHGEEVVVAYGFTAPDNDEAAMQGIHCFDPETELLTDQGWKPFPQVTGQERVLTLNGNVAEWGPITEVIAEDFDGYLNIHDGDRVNFAITDNHRLLASPAHYRKPDWLICPWCEQIVGAKGHKQHAGKHERAGDTRVNDDWEPAEDARRYWSLVPYADLPQEFFVRRTNTWRGSNPDTVVFERPTIEAVLCAGCGERITDSSAEERARARSGQPVFHVACRTLACRATVTCSSCGTVFTVPRSQAKRAKRLYCPGGTCRTGSSPILDPESTVHVPEFGPTLDPQAPNRVHRRYEFDFQDWATFLGWFVSEGSTTALGGSWDIRISQSREANEAKYEEIEALLTRMGIGFGRGANGLAFSSPTVGAWLREHCGVGSANKRIPTCIKEARPEMIRAFLDAFRKGDGCRHTHEDSARYITSSRQLADDLHEVMAKLGTARKMRVMQLKGSEGVNSEGRRFVRRETSYMLNEAGRPVDSNVKKSNVERVRYVGKVHCVSTPLQTIMVRRKGCPMWSGNSQRLLLVVDEAGGISRMIGGGTNNLLTGDARMLAIGNPAMNDPRSWFELMCDEGEDPDERDTITIPIPTLASPAITGERTPVCRDCEPNVDGHTVSMHMPTQDWVDRTIRDYGSEKHPYVVAKVFARFPKDAGNQAIPTSWVEAAIQREDPEPDDEWVRLCDLGLDGEDAEFTVKRGSWVRMGVDVAADGGDEFAIDRAVGDVVHPLHRSSGAQNSSQVDVAEKVLEHIHRAERLAKALGSTRKVRVKVDQNGLGYGVVGMLKRWGETGRHDAEIVGVMVSEAPERDDPGAALRPYRKRDEMWISMRMLLQPDPSTGLGMVRLRVDHKTQIQLSTPQLTYNAAGLSVIESKKSMRARGVGSPDRGDSSCLTVYEPFPVDAHKRRGLLN